MSQLRFSENVLQISDVGFSNLVLYLVYLVDLMFWGGDFSHLRERGSPWKPKVAS